MGLRKPPSGGASPPSGKVWKKVSDGASPQPPEPDPARWEILETKDRNGWCIVTVHYPGCTTYEGRKLLVYSCSSSVVRAQKLLDPHFLEQEGQLSPVARFEPTKLGLMLAEITCDRRPG
jgi:hypothetical protein